MLTMGMTREIGENDIYAVTDDMRSDQNTDAFAKLWQDELQRENPSIIRVIFKLSGFKALALSILYSIATTFVE